MLDINSHTVLLPQVFRPLNTRQSKRRINTIHACLILGCKRIVISAKIQVHLLESLVLGLGHKLPHKRRAHATEDGEEDVCAVRHAVRGQHILGGQTNDKVKHPVSRRDNRHTTRTHRVGEDLLWDDPRDGTPRVGKVGGKEPDEHHGGPARATVGGPVVHEGTLHTGDDGVADHHADGTCNEESLAAEFVEVEHGGDGEEDLEDTRDTRREEIGGGAGEAEA